MTDRPFLPHSTAPFKAKQRKKNGDSFTIAMTVKKKRKERLRTVSHLGVVKKNASSRYAKRRKNNEGFPRQRTSQKTATSQKAATSQKTFDTKGPLKKISGRYKKTTGDKRRPSFNLNTATVGSGGKRYFFWKQEGRWGIQTYGKFGCSTYR